MQYFYLITSTFLSASTGIIGGLYTSATKVKKAATSLYNFIMITSVFIAWLIMFIINGRYDLAVLPFSVLFAVFYVVCNISLIKALKEGSVMLTSLFLQLALIATSVWGLIFWQSQLSVFVVVGLILAAVSITFCLYKKESGKLDINLKWLLFAFLAFVGNAGCCIIQRTQQTIFDGNYGEFLMVVATAISTVVCGVIYFAGDKEGSAYIIKKASYLPAVSGICNAMLNLFVILMATGTLSPSLIYPMLSVGGLAITIVFSAVVFKEKMNIWQWLGLFLGAVATGLLSI